MLNECEVQIWSNDMSFYWQGAWEGLDRLDAVIYPFSGIKGKGIWWKKHGLDGIHLTKHFVEIFQIINFQAPEIAMDIRGEFEYKKEF